MSDRLKKSLLLAACLAALAAPVAAGPQDTKVGETRIAFSKSGTILRAEGNAIAKAVATLPAGTRVTVLEVKLPWVKVSATAGGAPVEGWLRAFEAIEPEALSATPPPAALSGTGGGNVSGRDVAAAGRQFTSDTERDYRASRQDLAAAYARVDEMEKATTAVDPYASITFVYEGDVIRRGHDVQLPQRLPPEPDASDEEFRVPDIPDSLPGPLGKLLPKKNLKKINKAMKYFKGAGNILRLATNLQAASFTPEHEYYLGRAVAANAIAKYNLVSDERLRAYVRLVGNAVVRVSERVGPNFGGYHFDVLDSPEVNGVSGPGGFVLVTKGALALCASEDDVAALLCHELAHVTLHHGRAIIAQNDQYKRNAAAFGAFVGSLESAVDSRIGTMLLDTFKSAVSAAAEVGVSHSWGREFEFHADDEGTNLLFDVFYDWGALEAYLVRHAATGKDAGETATHASPQTRATRLAQWRVPLGPYTARPETAAARQARFLAAMGRGR